MNAWMNEVVSVGGMTGTRAEYVDHLVAQCGWTYSEAVKIACHVKAAR